MNVVKLDRDHMLPVQSTSSKGNQGKWHIGQNWYKMDCAGYEALSEYITSEILKKSNVERFVKYELVKIDFCDNLYNGCVSYEMKNEGETLIPLERLFRKAYNMNLASELNRIHNPSETIPLVVKRLEEMGMKEAGTYITMLLEIDAFTFNQDRHTNNISFLVRNIENGKNQIQGAPIYDNGDAFFSDERYFPYSIDVRDLPRRTSAKPFSGSFKRQMQVAQSLYGAQFHTYFSKEDLAKALEHASEYYSDKTLRRVETLVEIQLETSNVTVPNAETIQAMEDIRNRSKLSEAFSSVADLMEELNADD